MRVLNQMGPGATEAITAAFPDVDVVEMQVAEHPPDGLQADAMFGGYGGGDLLGPWLDSGVQWVQAPGTGIDNLPPILFENGRTVTCARGVSAVPISEWVLAQILAWAKRLPETWLHGMPERWNVLTPPLDELDGQVLGLVGLGGIGAAVAQRALPFGMRVRAVRRTAAPSPVAGVEMLTDTDELIASADHLVLAAPATSRTAHLLDARTFGLMKPGVHIVNIARGSLIDQDALRVALDDGRVGLASLDTVTPEPLPEGHWMFEHPKVHLSPHVSWSTSRMVERNVAIFVANLGRFIAGEPLDGVADADEGY